jgi:hypothetical protein
MTRSFALALAMASFSLTAASTARAQSNASPTRVRAASTRGVVAPQRRAFVVYGGPMLGILGNGFDGRVNIEWQMHRDDHYAGHAFDIGASFTYWPGEFGPSAALSARWQYDHQLVSGALFFVSPYVGLDAGLGIFGIANGGEPRLRALAIPNAGVDIKVIAGRVLLMFRPIGITVPLSIGPDAPALYADVIYDIALGIGFLY